MFCPKAKKGSTMTFNNLDDLCSHLQKQINDTLKNEVAETAKEQLSEAVHKSVYNTYVPEHYKRRTDNGGLSDRTNFNVYEADNSVIITNDTPLDNGNTAYRLDDIVVNGMGYMPFPRDFYSEAAENISETNTLTAIMKEGLKRRGIETE